MYKRRLKSYGDLFSLVLASNRFVSGHGIIHVLGGNHDRSIGQVKLHQVTSLIGHHGNPSQRIIQLLLLDNNLFRVILRDHGIIVRETSFHQRANHLVISEREASHLLVELQTQLAIILR